MLQRHMMAQMLIERSILEEETDRGSEARSQVYSLRGNHRSMSCFNFAFQDIYFNGVLPVVLNPFCMLFLKVG